MSSTVGRIAAGVAAGAVVLGGLALAPSAIGAPGPDSPSADAPGMDTAAVAARWTPEARAAAIPRDLVIDERGLGYLKRADGSLEPYGHGNPAVRPGPSVVAVPSNGAPARPTPEKGKPGSVVDTEAPTVTITAPNPGAEVTGTQTFSATVTDNVRVRTVAFEFSADGGSTWISAGTPPSQSGSTWSQGISEFTPEGAWLFRVIATDSSSNTASESIGFTVDYSGSGSGGGGGTGGGDGVVTNAEWTQGGTVQTAAGRIYFYMPANRRQSSWTGYVCSGTAVRDNTSDRSVILTAAHCVYDDVNKAFAKDVLFIPNQAGTSAGGTDRVCSNDPLGCWAPAYGVVDADWTTRKFPANIPWDYAYYVVPESGTSYGHSGAGVDGPLDQVAGSLPISFTTAAAGHDAAALGYSYSDDPNFMYCSEKLATESSYGDWWLGQCGLSGGASGGPWLDPIAGGDGSVVSVNSWGYTTQPGMAGPNLSGSASCLFSAAKGATTTTQARGVVPATC